MCSTEPNLNIQSSISGFWWNVFAFSLVALLQCDPPLYQLDVNTVETNILRFCLGDTQMSPAEFCERMAGVDEEEVKALGQGVQVLMFPHVGETVRAVWHLGISEEDTQLAILKAKFVAQQHKLKSIKVEWKEPLTNQRCLHTSL